MTSCRVSTKLLDKKHDYHIKLREAKMTITRNMRRWVHEVLSHTMVVFSLAVTISKPCGEFALIAIITDCTVLISIKLELWQLVLFCKRKKVHAVKIVQDTLTHDGLCRKRYCNYIIPCLYGQNSIMLVVFWEKRVQFWEFIGSLL